MVKVQTLRKRSDFLWLKEHGARAHAQGFVLQWAVREGFEGCHVGFTASTKGVGNSVARNRARRRLRAALDKALRLNPAVCAPQGLWLNIVAKKAVLEMDFAYLEKDMHKTLAEAGVAW